MITLIIPYFGSLPNYFQLYLDSLAVNVQHLTVLLITDINLSEYRIPPNLKRIYMTMDELREHIRANMLEIFGRSPDAIDLIPTPYKLVDFKIMYPLLFKNLYKASLDDYVGWGDIDVIYGDLSKFITSSYDVIGGHHGHFTAVKNILALKTLFMSTPNLYEYCCDPSKTYITDEIAFRPVLDTYIKTNELKVLQLYESFCDIVPPCFYSIFRPDSASFSINFFNVAKPRKNILYLLRESNGSLKTFYDDLEIQETSYVHLQKRKLKVSEQTSDQYYITETKFMSSAEKECIPRNLFLTWSTKDLPDFLAANLETLRTQNPELTVQLFDDTDCRYFLETYFHIDVLRAFDALKPGAFKADLWRLCILYIYGGIYMDIKLQSKIPLIQLLTREYFVYDGNFKKAGIQYSSVYNGLITSKPSNPFLLKAIVNIVINVSKQFYGQTPYEPTGPHMLGKHIEPDYTFLLTHHGPKNNETIWFHNTLIMTECPEYRSFLKDRPYYADMWTKRDIYSEKLCLRTSEWPTKMRNCVLDTSKPSIRLHLPAIPYTLTTDEYSHDAFTGKVKRFSPMMQSLNYEVYHYCIEGSESGARKQIPLMTLEEWNRLRIESLMYLDPTLTHETAEAKLRDPKTLVGCLANYTTPLFKEFNRRFGEALKQNYRSQTTDIVCVPLGRSYTEALNGPYTIVEFGIGYSNSFANYRIFESYSWLSKTVGEEKKDPNNYWFVIPHGFDTTHMKPVTGPPLERPRIGFLGRVVAEKGGYVITELAKRFPAVDFVLCGQGDPSPFLTSPNISYQSPIHGDKRAEYLSSCVATLCPTIYLEPFGCSSVESQLCGTPVISVDSGGYVETVEQFKTGLRCHTLADFCSGVQMALEGAFDRTYVRERAVRLYDMHALAPHYEYVFQSVLDIFRREKNGWYSPDCHMYVTNRHTY